MIIEFIFTFNDRPQEIKQYPFADSILKDKKSLFEFATSKMPDDAKIKLVKISSCVITNGAQFNMPKWYAEARGKLWISNGKLE